MCLCCWRWDRFRCSGLALGRSRGNNCNAAGRLVKELPLKAEIVAEGAQWGAVAEGVVVPQPHHRAAGVGDLMRRAKMVRRDIEMPARLKHGDRQIAEPHSLLQKFAVAVVFAGQMARLVIDEEELRNAHIDLRYALPETVDQPARANRSDKSLRLAIARVVAKLYPENGVE